jgi:acyl-CoA dehydrogenase
MTMPRTPKADSSTAPDLTPALDAADLATFRDTVRAWVDAEIVPHVNGWDEAGSFPRALYRRAAELGLLQLGYPDSLGGTPCPMAFRLAAAEEVARAGSGGLMASLFSHNIGLPPIVEHAHDALRQRIVPPVLAGEAIAALAITEPGGGSDVARLRTTARLEGGHWVVDGEKTFITSGLRADWLTVAVRTGGAGAAGISLLSVPGASVGLSRTPLDKMGWWCSDTAHLRFDHVRVPADHLIGEAGAGFRMIMANFNAERLLLSAGAVAFAQVCLDEALDWARQRHTFGQPLVAHQVVRHRLADMRMHIQASRALLSDITTRFENHPADADTVADLCLLKNHATQTMQFCADAAVQTLGGMGYMRGTRSERIYREVKVMMIGGGAEEIMKELAARQLGW